MHRFGNIFTLSLVMALSVTGCSDSKKKFFTLSCSSATTCTKTANTYLVNVDGLFVELSPEFVEQCQKNEANNVEINLYCKKMIAPGHTETFSAPADVIKHLQEEGFTNPTDADVDRRMKAAQEKIDNSIL
jgi:hypothetical protein